MGDRGVSSDSNIYTDANGRRWTIRLNVAALERNRSGGGFDPMLFVLDASSKTWATAYDPIALAALGWSACEPQAIASGVNREQFLEAVRGDAIESLREAWFAAFADFLPSLQREALLRDKGRIHDHLKAVLSESRNSGGQTSTTVQASAESIPAH